MFLFDYAKTSLNDKNNFVKFILKKIMRIFENLKIIIMFEERKAETFSQTFEIKFKNDIKKKCKHCEKSHENANCWFVHSKNIFEFFIKRFFIKDDRKTNLQKIRNKKQFKSKTTFVKILSIKFSIVKIFNIKMKQKNNAWYFDFATTIHFIHDFILFEIDISDQNIDVETANDDIIQIKKTKTMTLKIVLKNCQKKIKLINVHYYSEIEFNLLSLNTVESQKHHWLTKNDLLTLHEKNIENILFQKQRH